MPFVEGQRRFDSKIELRDSVLFRHQLLDNAKGVKLKTARRKPAEDFLSTSVVVLEEMREEYADWIGQQTEGLSEGTTKKVEVSFRNGLRTFILRQYKIARINSLNPEDHLDVPGLIAGYSLDFAKVFHGTRKLGIKSEMAAEIAAQSSYHRPGVLIGLVSKYRNLPPGIIHEAIKHPLRNPGEYLTNFTIALSRLLNNPRYEDFGRRLVMVAIKGYIDPEDFLNKAIAAIDRISSDPRYAGFSLAEIRYVVIENTKNPETTLDRLIVGKKRFLEDPRFEILAPSTIKKTLRTNPRNPENTLLALVDAINAILVNKKYQGLTKSAIEIIISRHPKDYIDYLDKLISSRNRLLRNSRYADFPSSIIDRAIFNHPNSPEKFLDGLIRSRDTLLQDRRYRGVNPSTIIRVLTHSPKNYRNLLNNYVATVKRLSGNFRYQDISEGFIRKFVLSHLGNAEKAFEKFVQIRAKLLSDPRYAKLGISNIEKIVFGSANPDERSQEVNRTTKRLLLDPHYKNIPLGIINKAVIDYSNPEKFLEAYMTKKRQSSKDQILRGFPENAKEDSGLGNNDTDSSEDMSVIAEELIDLWDYMQNHEGMQARAIGKGLLTDDELKELTEFFEGEGEVPTGAVLDRFSLAVAKLA